MFIINFFLDTNNIFFKFVWITFYFLEINFQFVDFLLSKIKFFGANTMRERLKFFMSLTSSTVVENIVDSYRRFFCCE